MSNTIERAGKVYTYDERTDTFVYGEYESQRQREDAEAEAILQLNVPIPVERFADTHFHVLDKMNWVATVRVDCTPTLFKCLLRDDNAEGTPWVDPSFEEAHPNWKDYTVNQLLATEYRPYSIGRLFFVVPPAEDGGFHTAGWCASLYPVKDEVVLYDRDVTNVETITILSIDKGEDNEKN